MRIVKNSVTPITNGFSKKPSGMAVTRWWWDLPNHDWCGKMK